MADPHAGLILSTSTYSTYLRTYGIPILPCSFGDHASLAGFGRISHHHGCMRPVARCLDGARVAEERKTEEYMLAPVSSPGLLIPQIKQRSAEEDHAEVPGSARLAAERASPKRGVNNRYEVSIIIHSQRVVMSLDAPLIIGLTLQPFGAFRQPQRKAIF